MSSADRPRVVLVGVGPTTATALAGLLDGFEVTTLLRPGDDDVTGLAAREGVTVEGDTSVASLTRVVDRDRPDAVVVSSYDRILPAALVAGRPFVNVHYAPLPRYRGRATVNWALINGEPDAHISIHCLEPSLDAGGLLFTGSVPIGPADTVSTLYDQLNDLQRKHLGDAVRRRLAGDLGTAQDESAASYSCTRLPEDGEITWAEPTAKLDRLIRALAPPFPAAYTYLGLRRLEVLRAEVRHDAPRYDGRVPGRPVGRSSAEGWVDVLTGDGVLRLRTVRLEGSEPAPAATVIRSVKQTLGLHTHGLLTLIAELQSRLEPLGEA
ncbi:methionyl-tRNA formyltransferase [Actinoplanes solisilvae]|uniref:methionyl-tRNA formyltransferase n=1 Tax=Actinoplanes solisilvae TaxID=2486853 RepID=UPI000FD92D0C|nr:formyltransferase family protein [Actinoplanes solisilvae]